MDFYKEYDRIMEKECNMALATSEDNMPNVRIVSFGYNPSKRGTIYFTTFRIKEKVKEFEKNDRVAFTIVPQEMIALYEVNFTEATVILGINQQSKLKF